jgi:hypothetical protein
VVGTWHQLFEWTESITNPRGISSWWQFLEARRLATGANVPGVGELQTCASRLEVGTTAITTEPAWL